MSHSKTWPGGATNTSPASFSIPDSGDLNWANLTAFLDALGDSAQATTFQKYAVRKALTTPVTVSASTDCVVVTQLTSPGAVVVNLPAGANKQVYFIADGTGDAGTNNITINPNGADTIAGSASLVLNINRESTMLCYNSSDTDWKIVALNAAGFTNPMTTRGDMIYRNTSNVTARFPVGSANTVLKSDGTDPAYAQIVDAYISASAAITGSKIVSASASVAGVVDIATQTFAGAKTLNGATTIGAAGTVTGSQPKHVLNGQLNSGATGSADQDIRFAVGANYYIDASFNSRTVTANTGGFYQVMARTTNNNTHEWYVNQTSDGSTTAADPVGFITAAQVWGVGNPNARTSTHAAYGALNVLPSSTYISHIGTPDSTGASTTLADNGTVTINGAGGKIIGIYDNSTGNFGLFACGVNGTLITQILTDGGTWFVVDAGVGYRIFKSSSSTTVTFRNSTGGAKIIGITLYGSPFIP